MEKEPFPVKPPAAKEPAPPPPEKALREEEKKISQIPLVKLDQGDDLVRERGKDLSSHSKLFDWLKVKNIIRKITAAVDNIANGQSPRAHLGFLSPKKSFTIIKKGERLYLNPQSYRRYNLVAEVLHSLDAQASVRIYQELKPLFQEAYRELGYANQDFHDTLVRAIEELLSTPAVEGDILSEEGVIAYQMVDGNLEDLSDAEKHLLRMGPQNTRKIQAKLGEMALALGIPENKIPKFKVYFSKTK